MASVNQGLIEREIFKRFARVCPLPILLKSIEKREPPEPDILCEIRGQGKVTFEMVELVDENFSKRLHSGVQLRHQFEAACRDHPKMKERFGDAFIYVEFHTHTSKQKRNQCIPWVIDLLLKLPQSFKGDVPLNQQGRLAEVLKDLAVQRGCSNGPLFGTIPAAPRVDQSIKLIKQKFKKCYKTTMPLELLTYFYQQPPPRTNQCTSVLEGYIAEHLASSPFRRVWVYDNWSKEVKYPTISGARKTTKEVVW